MTTLSELPITKLAELIPSADLANYYKDPNWRPDSRLARLAEIASAYKGDRVDPAKIVSRVIAPELDKGIRAFSVSRSIYSLNMNAGPSPRGIPNHADPHRRYHRH
jgi:hypothetical protein